MAILRSSIMISSTCSTRAKKARKQEHSTLDYMVAIYGGLRVAVAVECGDWPQPESQNGERENENGPSSSVDHPYMHIVTIF